MNEKDFNEALQLLVNITQTICDSGRDPVRLEVLSRTFAILAGALANFTARPEALAQVADAVRAGYESAPEGDVAFQTFVRQVIES